MKTTFAEKSCTKDLSCASSFQRGDSTWPELADKHLRLRVEEDGAVYQMRRWYQQFYVDVADISPDMIDRFELEVDTTKANEKWHVEVEENLRRQAAEKAGKA